MTGLRPIIEGMNMGFLLLAYNQISNNAGMLHYTSGGQYKVLVVCLYKRAIYLVHLPKGMFTACASHAVFRAQVDSTRRYTKASPANTATQATHVSLQSTA